MQPLKVGNIRNFVFSPVSNQGSSLMQPIEYSNVSVLSETSSLCTLIDQLTPIIPDTRWLEILISTTTTQHLILV